MTKIRARTVVHRGIFFAVFVLLTVVAASSSTTKPLVQQRSGTRAIELVQRAVREQIITREGRQKQIVQFNNDAQTQYQSNATVLVRGTGTSSQNNNRRSRNFSYVAIVNNRDGNVSAIKYDWLDDWSSSSGGNENAGYGKGSCSSATRWDETEAGYTGVWTRRGSSNVFDAVWTKDRQQVTAVLTITNQGNRVFVKRTSSSDGYLCEYEGAIAADGITVTGTMRCPGNPTSLSWQATIDCRGANNSGGNYATTRLTGTYRLNQLRSDNSRTIVDRTTSNLPGSEQQRLRNRLLRRLEAPESLAIEQRGRSITIASSGATQVTFEADGREQTEQTRNGQSIRTSATLTGDTLMVNSEGDRSLDYQVTFEPINNGRGLRVTRRISDEGLRQPVVARSVYDKTSNAAQLDLYTGIRNEASQTDTTRANFAVPDGTQMMAVLNTNLSTKQARDGDRFTLTVRSPSQYDGASIEGHVAQINRSGRVSGRAEMSFEFDRIRLRDGRTTNFAGYIDSVRTTSGETIRVDNEGRAQDDDNQTNRTVTRGGVGAAIGAVIGAIAGGGKGAAIGAAVGAGAGAGSVIVQGRDDLDLMSGTEFTIRASAPR